jgi:hypothetical protein
LEYKTLQSKNHNSSNLYSRKVFAVVENRDELDPLDFFVAGPSVLFMVIDIFFYWFIVWTFERGVWKSLWSYIVRVFRRRYLLDEQKELAVEFEDEDIIEEE